MLCMRWSVEVGRGVRWIDTIAIAAQFAPFSRVYSPTPFFSPLPGLLEAPMGSAQSRAMAHVSLTEHACRN